MAGEGIIAELFIKLGLDDSATPALGKADAQLGKTGTSTVNYTEKVSNLTTGLVSMGHSVDRVMNMFDRYEITQMTVENSSMRVTSAQINLNEAISKFGPNSQEAIDAARSLEIAQNNLEKTNIRAQSSMVLIGLSALSMAPSFLTATKSALTFAASGAVIATAGGVITMALGAISAGVSTLYAVILANPIGAALVIIAAAAVALKIAWDNNWYDIQGRTESATDAILAALDQIPGATDAINYVSTAMVSNREVMMASMGPLGLAYTAWLNFTGGVKDNTTAQKSNQDTLVKTLSLLSDLENVLYDYYSAEEKVASIEERMARMRAEEADATGNYNKAVNDLNISLAKDAEIEEKINILVQDGMIDTPIYTALIREHERAETDIEAAKQKVITADEVYARYRDKAIIDSPTYKKLELELAQAEQELAEKIAAKNQKLAEGVPAEELNKASMAGTSNFIKDFGIPTWAGYEKAVSTSTTNSTTNIKNLNRDATAEFTAMKSALGLLIDLTVKAIQERWQWLYNILVGKSIIPDMCRDILAAFTGMWNNLGVLFTTWTNIIKNTVDTWKTNLSSGINSFISEIQTKWASFWNGVSSTVNTFSSVIRTNVSSLISGLTSSISSFISNTLSTWNSFWSVFSSTVNNYSSMVRGNVTNLTSSISSSISNFISNTRTNWGSFWSGISSITNLYRTTIERNVFYLTASIWASITTMISNSRSSWNSFWEGLYSTTGAYVKYITNMINNLWNLAKAAYTYIANEPYVDWSGNYGDSGSGTAWSGDSYSDWGDMWSGDTGWSGDTAGYGDSWSDYVGAKGGIVKAKPGGTKVTIGEAGQDEAIIPLPGFLNNPGIGNNVTVNMSFGNVYGVDDINKAIDAAVANLYRNIKSMGG